MAESNLTSPEHPTLVELADRVRADFLSTFGVEPEAVASAPGRVNLIGDHTDYAGGFVLPIAIDRWCLCAASRTDEPVWNLRAADLDEQLALSVESGVPSADQVRTASDSGSVGRWPSYLAGVAALACRGLRPGEPRGLCMSVLSSVPLGSGLSSSAALEVSVSAALDAICGAQRTPRDRALLCQRAEHAYAGVPCGIMDQLVAVAGTAGHALRIDCASLDIDRVSLPDESEISILLLGSGVKHDLAQSKYPELQRAARDAAERLGVARLRDVPSLEFAGAGPVLSDEQERAVRHVFTENHRVCRFSQCLTRRDYVGAGRLMAESHESLRHTLRVSCDEVDRIADDANGHPAVFGARMTGGGFGGYVVAFVEAGRAAEVVSATGVSDAMVVRAVDGAAVIR